MRHEVNHDDKSLTFAIYNNMGLFIIGIPVGVALSSVAGGTLIIKVVLVLLSFTFTMVILFFDIWYNIFFAHRDLIGQVTKSINAATRKQAPPPSTTTTTMSGSKNSSKTQTQNSQSSKDSST